MPIISPAPTSSTTPTISSRPHRRAPTVPCGSAAAGFSATALAPARAARSRRSFSTTGSKADAAAVWISKSDKLIEDAERDWTAIGGYRSDLVPLSRFRQGAAIALDEGILFTTYATLRTQAKSLPRTGSGGGRSSCPAVTNRSSTGSGYGFDGVVVFDEAHAMANAAGDKSLPRTRSGENAARRNRPARPGRLAPAACAQ